MTRTIGTNLSPLLDLVDFWNLERSSCRVVDNGLLAHLLLSSFRHYGGTIGGFHHHLLRESVQKRHRNHLALQKRLLSPLIWNSDNSISNQEEKCSLAHNAMVHQSGKGKHTCRGPVYSNQYFTSSGGVSSNSLFLETRSSSKAFI